MVGLLRLIATAPCQGVKDIAIWHVSLDTCTPQFFSAMSEEHLAIIPFHAVQVC